MKLASIPAHLVQLPPQLHRADLDARELDDLAHSIATSGLLNPITVRELPVGFELVAGHRRYLACAQLGWTHIPATVLEGDKADDAAAETARIVENLHRANLSPIEEALPIARMQDDQHMTVEQIARTVHRSAGWVRERLQLAELNDELRALVHERQLAIGAALLLADITDASHRQHLTRYALHDGVSVPVLRSWVNEWHQAQAAGEGATAPLPELPGPGAPLIILVPCFLCRTPTDHTRTAAARICPECYQAAASNQPQPQPHQAAH